jgi:flagellar biosynthetic protein FliO
MVWPVLKMIFALGLFLVLFFFLIRLLKRVDWIKGKRSSGGSIQVLTSQCIAPQKYVSLVEIGGEILVLGISAQQITFLTKIANQDSLKKILAASGSSSNGPPWLNIWPFQAKRIKENGLEIRHES